MKLKIGVKRYEVLSEGDLIIADTTVGAVHFLVVRSLHCEEVRYTLLNMSTMTLSTNIQVDDIDELIPAMQRTLRAEIVEVISTDELELRRED